MTKTILVMALAATLVLTTFALASAVFAVEEGDNLRIEVKGPIMCILPDIDEQRCGQAKARFNISVANLNEDGSYSGTAMGQVLLRGTAVGNPGNVRNIISDQPLSYTYDALGRLLITGEMVDPDGNIWTLEGEGSYQLKPKGKSKIDLVLNLGGQEGEEFTLPTHGSVFQHIDKASP